MASCLTVSGSGGKVITLDIIAMVMATSLTLFVPSWNRIAVILDSVFMIVSSCLALSVPRGKIITLDRITGVIASCLTLFAPSWNIEQ